MAAKSARLNLPSTNRIAPRRSMSLMANLSLPVRRFGMIKIYCGWTPRIALEDIRIGDVEIAAGQVVLPSLTAAAHDPKRVKCPGEVDILQAAPRKIVFGAGSHLCPGTPKQAMDYDCAQRNSLQPYPRCAWPFPKMNFSGVAQDWQYLIPSQ